MNVKRISLVISVNIYCTAMYYSTLFLICSHIPSKGDRLNEFVSNTMGIGFFLLILIWYFDRRETNRTLVCISPNRMPEKIRNSVFRMGVVQRVPKPMSQTSSSYSPPVIKQKSSYQHGSKSEQVPRYPLTFMFGYPLRYYIRCSKFESNTSTHFKCSELSTSSDGLYGAVACSRDTAYALLTGYELLHTQSADPQRNLCHKLLLVIPHPLIKQKSSYQHGSKSEQVPRYPLTFMCGYPLRYYIRCSKC
jgi:hypothetical protein